MNEWMSECVSVWIWAPNLISLFLFYCFLFECIFKWVSYWLFETCFQIFYHHLVILLISLINLIKLIGEIITIMLLVIMTTTMAIIMAMIQKQTNPQVSHRHAWDSRSWTTTSTTTTPSEAINKRAASLETCRHFDLRSLLLWPQTSARSHSF